MRSLTKKLKQSIVMLLVCAMVAGSVPVNAFAAEVDNQTVATEETSADEVAVEDVVTEDVTTEMPVTETSLNEDGTVQETEDVSVEDGGYF